MTMYSFVVEQQLILGHASTAVLNTVTSESAYRSRLEKLLANVSCECFVPVWLRMHFWWKADMLLTECSGNKLHAEAQRIISLMVSSFASDVWRLNFDSEWNRPYLVSAALSLAIYCFQSVWHRLDSVTLHTCIWFDEFQRPTRGTGQPPHSSRWNGWRRNQLTSIAENFRDYSNEQRNIERILNFRLCNRSKKYICFSSYCCFKTRLHALVDRSPKSWFFRFKSWSHRVGLHFLQILAAINLTPDLGKRQIVSCYMTEVTQHFFYLWFYPWRTTATIFVHRSHPLKQLLALLQSPHTSARVSIWKLNYFRRMRRLQSVNIETETVYWVFDCQKM